MDCIEDDRGDVIDRFGQKGDFQERENCKEVVDKPIVIGEEDFGGWIIPQCQVRQNHMQIKQNQCETISLVSTIARKVIFISMNGFSGQSLGL